MNRQTIVSLVVVISIVDAFIIGAILTKAVSPTVGAIGFVGGALLPIALLYTVIPMFVSLTGWNRLHELYPCEDPAVFDSGAKLVSSLGVRSAAMSFNNVTQGKATDSHLHLRINLPGPVWKRAVSIPWEAVSELKPGPMRTRLVVDDAPDLWVPHRLVRDERDLRDAMEADDRAEGDEPEEPRA